MQECFANATTSSNNFSKGKQVQVETAAGVEINNDHRVFESHASVMMTEFQIVLRMKMCFLCQVFVGSASDGVLEAGDRLLSINKRPTEGITHVEAQNIFRLDGDDDDDEYIQAILKIMMML